MSIQLRQQIDKLVSLTNQEFEAVLTCFKPRKFKKHQIVINEGDPVPYDYFVVKGLMKSSHTNLTGKEHVIQFAMEDWWITDPQAFHNKTMATLTVSCLEDTEVLGLTLEGKETLCRDFQKMEHFFLKKTIAGYMALQKRILSLISLSTNERYQSFVMQYPGLLQRLPKTMIASYLGVSRETLSRLS